MTHLGRRASVLAIYFILAGAVTSCGGSSSDDDTKKAEPTAPTSTSAAPALEDLKTICPKVEATLPAGMLVPSPEQLVQIHNDVMAIEANADLEAKNALELFMRGMTDAVNAYNDSSDPAPGLSVSQAFDDGLSAFADRCKAAGSSALQ